MRALILTTLMLCGLLAGCGQKGPLYLPEEQPAPSAEQPSGPDREESAD